MRVLTPIADMDVTVARITVEGGRLVMTNSADDAMATRAEMNPRDVRRIVSALLRPRMLWFVLMCMVRSGGEPSRATQPDDTHPTPNPW